MRENYKKIFINNVVYDVLSNSSIKRNIDKTLDQIIINISTEQEIELNKFDIMFFLVGDGDELQFLIMDYTVEKKLSRVYYTITGIEPTKMLENIILCGLAISNGDNIYEQFGKAMQKISNISNKFNLVLDPSFGNDEPNSWIIEDLKRKKPENFIFSGTITAREVFDTILSSADYEIRVSMIEKNQNETIIYLAIDDPNIQGDTINLENNKNYRITTDGEYNVGGLISVVSNGVPDKYIFQLNQVLRDTGFDTPNDQYKLLTDYPIESIGKLFANARVLVETSPTSSKYIDEEIDLTPYLIEKEVYDAIDNETKDERVYFKRYSPNVFGFNKIFKESWLIGDKTIIQNILDKHFNKTSFPKKTYYIKDYQLSYRPILNAYFDTIKKDGDFTRILNNQSEKNVDLSRLNKTNTALANKVGNEHMILETSVDYNIGDRTSDGFIICSYDLKITSSRYYYKYNLFKKNNSINMRMAIRREKQSFNIPLDNYVDRYIDCGVAKIGNTIPIADCILIHTQFNMKTGYYCWLPLARYGDYLIATFTNNIICGYYNLFKSGKTNNYAIKYTDDNGELGSIDAWFGYSGDIPDVLNNPKTYPLLISYENISSYLPKAPTISGIWKDKYERLILVFKKE